MLKTINIEVFPGGETSMVPPDSKIFAIQQTAVTVRIIGRYTMVASDQQYRFGEIMAVDFPLKRGMKQDEERFSLPRSDPKGSK